MATRFTQALGSFKFPIEIKNDIIYCQRALMSHIKVHQMIVEQFSKEKEYSTAKQACLADLENKIYEINCEQQYLLLRVRRIIDEFFKALSREDIKGDRAVMNNFVSQQLVPLIQNKQYVCVPAIVCIRMSEIELIETYLSPDSCKQLGEKPPTPTKEIPPPPPEPIAMTAALSAKQVSLLKPISLLKPKSERVAQPTPARKSIVEIIVPEEEKPTPEPSSKVRLSRMNLRQALNKAAAAINVVALQVPAFPVVSVTKPKFATEVLRKVPAKQSKSEPSSSEESVDVRMPSPPQLDLKTKPDDYTQESFMRLFNLFTQDQIAQMQQRRSKRKRRGAHNNEKADFHYGKFDHMLPTTSKKRKKEFLLSPRVNRALKKKIDSEVDRSNSSSPHDKPMCNECMKPDGQLTQCKDCLGSYHESCHRDLSINTIPGQCPSCSRINFNAKQHQDKAEKINAVALHGKYRELEMKLALEQQRREQLQQESKMYKIDMRKLFNIVETIKSDENDS